MAQLSNVRGSHVKDANVAIAAIHVKHHPAVFPMALSFYSIPSATGAPDAAAGLPPHAPQFVRGGFSHSSESHMRYWKVRGGEHAGMYGASRRVGKLDGDKNETVSLLLPVIVAGRGLFHSNYLTRSNRLHRELRVSSKIVQVPAQGRTREWRWCLLGLVQGLVIGGLGTYTWSIKRRHRRPYHLPGQLLYRRNVAGWSACLR